MGYTERWFGFTDFFSLVPAGVAVILPPAALVFGVGCIAATAEKHADKAVFALCIPILIPAFFHEFRIWTGTVSVFGEIMQLPFQQQTRLFLYLLRCC